MKSLARVCWIRRSILAFVTMAAVFLAAIHPSSAVAGFPDRPVKIIVGSTAGSAVDVIARLFAQHLSEAWTQPVIVENRGGANGQIAARAVAQSAPDGYTLMISTAATLATNPVFFPENGSFVLDQLDPITMLVSNDFVIAVRASLNIKTLPDLVAFAKKNPGKLNVATSVQGGAANLAAELFKRRAQLDYSVIPHNGGGASINSLLGEHTDATFESLTLTAPLAEVGRIVHLATTGLTRSEFTPAVPTVANLGFQDFKVSGWLGLLGPKDMPPEVVAQIGGDLRKIATNKAIVDQVSKVKMYTVLNSPAEFRQLWSAEVQMWRDLAARLKPN